MFVGFEKPWSTELPLYSAMTCRALVDLVRTIKSGQLEAYGWRGDDQEGGWRTPTLLAKEDFQALVDEWEANSTEAIEQR